MNWNKTAKCANVQNTWLANLNKTDKAELEVNFYTKKTPGVSYAMYYVELGAVNQAQSYVPTQS